jgi:hypothetical protein
MIANYNGNYTGQNRNVIPDYKPLPKSPNAIDMSGLNMEYTGFALPPLPQTNVASLAADLSNSADSLKQSLGSVMEPPSFNIAPVTSPENEDKDPAPKSEDGLIASLIKLLICIITLGKKLGIAFSAILNASMGLTMSTDGILRIAAITVFHIADIFQVSIEVVMKNITLLTDFAIKLPKCFLVHIIKIFFAILYNIFPLMSYIFWSFTDVSLMPAFNAVFKVLDDGDNWIADNIFEELVYQLPVFPSESCIPGKSKYQ